MLLWRSTIIWLQDQVSSVLATSTHLSFAHETIMGWHSMLLWRSTISRSQNQASSLLATSTNLSFAHDTMVGKQHTVVLLRRSTTSRQHYRVSSLLATSTDMCFSHDITDMHALLGCQENVLWCCEGAQSVRWHVVLLWRCTISGIVYCAGVRVQNQWNNKLCSCKGVK